MLPKSGILQENVVGIMEEEINNGLLCQDHTNLNSLVQADVESTSSVIESTYTVSMHASSVMESVYLYYN